MNITKVELYKTGDGHEATALYDGDELVALVFDGRINAHEPQMALGGLCNYHDAVLWQTWRPDLTWDDPDLPGTTRVELAA